MTPEQEFKIRDTIVHCKRQIEIQGVNAQISMVVKGKWGKTNYRRLFPGGPKGEIVLERPDKTLVVFFNAQEVLAAMRKILREEGKE